MKIEKEKFSDELMAEVLPLAQKCWDESTAFKGETCAYVGERDFKIEPNIDAYRTIDEQGLLVIITLRDETKLVGYAIGFLYTAMHHKHILCAIGDSIYIEPEFRSYTAVVASKLESEVKELGAEIMGWPVHFNGPVYELLKAMHYVGDDIVMEKRLCVSQPQSLEQPQ